MNEEIQIILETTEKVLHKNINHQLRQNTDQNNYDIINLWICAFLAALMTSV